MTGDEKVVENRAEIIVPTVPSGTLKACVSRAPSPYSVHGIGVDGIT